MCERCEKTISKLWVGLQPGEMYSTPDLARGKVFSVHEKSVGGIRIDPQNMSITKEAFMATVHYLAENRHYSDNECEIHSSNSRENAGPLCRAARDKNHNVRCINYILPILQKFQIVGIDPARPNKTWLMR